MKQQQDKRSVEIRIPSELGYEKVAISATATIARKMGFTSDRVEDLKTAVSEACINAIEHGNELDVRSQVKVLFTVEVDTIQVSVIDHGHQPIPDSIPDRSSRRDFRGMGLYLIYNLMDKVEVKSQPRRNEIRMINHLNLLPSTS